jgi:hypothetical protein
MTELKHLYGEGRRLRFALCLSLILLTTIGSSLTAWSVRARSQGAQTEAASDAAADNAQDASQESGNARETAPAGQASEHAPSSASPNADAHAERPTLQPAFTVTWRRTATAPDGQTRLLQTTTRSQRADGAYRLVHTYAAQERVVAREEVSFGFNGLGVFRLDAERKLLDFTAPLVDDGAQDVLKVLREDPRFDREEDVQGQQTIVLRTPASRGEGYTEDYRAPALGGLLLKRVEASERERRVMEPTEIELGEPDARLFAELNQYPVDYTRYEQSIAQAERGRQHDVARLMRELMRRMKAFKPGRR